VIALTDQMLAALTAKASLMAPALTLLRWPTFDDQVLSASRFRQTIAPSTLRR
jgi:hypothetical protein